MNSPILPVNPIDHMGLVYSEARVLFPKWPYEWDELVSTLTLVLVECCHKFDPTLGYKFSSYALTAMYRTYLKIMSKHYHNKKHISLVLDEVSAEDLSEPEAFDLILSQQGIYSKIELEECEKPCIHIAKTLLTPLQTKILELFQNSSSTSATRIAKQCGCSTQHVLNTIRKYAKEE